jgi:hypothetical protein
MIGFVLLLLFVVLLRPVAFSIVLFMAGLCNERSDDDRRRSLDVFGWRELLPIS